MTLLGKMGSKTTCKYQYYVLIISVAYLSTSFVQGFNIGVRGTTCSLDPSEHQNACQSLYDAECDGAHCKCPSGTHEDKGLKKCVPGVGPTKKVQHDDFGDLPFDYAPDKKPESKPTPKPPTQPPPQQPPPPPVQPRVPAQPQAPVEGGYKPNSNIPKPGYPIQPGYPGYSGYPNQPAGYPNQPAGYPNQPGFNPNQPGYNPKQPGYNPNQPGYDPNQPGYNPKQPAHPNQPGYNPSQPGYNPNQPGFNPNNPAYNPNQPGYNPYQPGYNPNNPNPYNPNHPGYNQPGYNPNQPGIYNPNQPGYNPNQPGIYNPNQPGKKGHGKETYSGDPHIGEKAGGGIGGGLGFLVLVGLVYFCCCRGEKGQNLRSKIPFLKGRQSQPGVNYQMQQPQPGQYPNSPPPAAE